MPRPIANLLAAAGCALALTACGNERQPPPAVAVAGPPLGAAPARYPAAGLAFLAPGGWARNPGVTPLVATVTTGRAAMAIFRYPRTEPLPKTRAELDAALAALAGAALQRDPAFKELARGRLRVDGRPAVVLRGTQVVGGQQRTVRSTHVYVDGAEVVVDATAPSADFKRIDAQAFRALVRSLRFSDPVT